jgi:BirA family transcriptional regulator, biotin operon repressor / biotin---[acetyl-CoA-carboxylase] ligase
MAIDVARVRSETRIQEVAWLEEVDSTNTLALQRAGDLRTVMPFLIGTDRQVAGRGRGGNRWWGADGALMFSIGVEMPALGLAMAQWPRFSLITGLAIADALSICIPAARAGVKWPNDVWLNGRKVCGILIEQVDLVPNRLIVGIGINVNNSFAHAPDEQQRIATSMKDSAAGSEFSLTDVLLTFLNRWKSLTDELAEGTINLVERWSHACVLSGRPIVVTAGDRSLTGICAGIDDDGSLLLRTEWTMERCYAGTVRLLD